MQSGQNKRKEEKWRFTTFTNQKDNDTGLESERIPAPCRILSCIKEENEPMEKVIIAILSSVIVILTEIFKDK